MYYVFFALDRSLAHIILEQGQFSERFTGLDHGYFLVITVIDPFVCDIVDGKLVRRYC